VQFWFWESENPFKQTKSCRNSGIELETSHIQSENHTTRPIILSLFIFTFRSLPHFAPSSSSIRFIFWYKVQFLNIIAINRWCRIIWSDMTWHDMMNIC
jgi:hypothetical protein